MHQAKTIYFAFDTRRSQPRLFGCEHDCRHEPPIHAGVGIAGSTNGAISCRYLSASRCNFYGMSNQSEYTARTPLQVRSCAKALIGSGNCILLVKEQHADGTKFWTLPGGGVRAGETYVGALARELREELQCLIAGVSPRETVWYAHTSCQSKLSQWTVFRCTLRTPVAPNLAEGILSYQWARPETLPERTLPQVRQLLR